jgi:NTE family protein
MRALVLGGGGVTGVAWEIGLLAGLRDAGVDLSTADVVIGTSAGSVVAAQLTGGLELEELYERQLRGAVRELPARLGAASLVRYAYAALMPGDERRMSARLGRMALRARTVSEAERRAVIADRVPVREWPDRRLLITAIDAETGEFRVFDRDSGVDIVDAVAASCAVPLVWAPVTIDGRRYIDGGIRSPANVDLAAGCNQVVVLAPSAAALRRSARPAAQLAALGPQIRSALVSPDQQALKDMGRNVLDPAYRAAAARTGRRQAATVDLGGAW